MTRLTQKVASFAFQDELAKTAGPALQAAIQRGLGGLGAGAGMGALGGGLVGAVHGYRKARQEGGGVGESLAAGVGQVGKGALRGAAVGGLGLGVAQAAGRVPGLAEKLTQIPYAGAFSRFGQRQVHGLTGWTPKGFGNAEGIQALGLGSSEAQKELLDRWRRNAPLASAQTYHAAARRAEDMGLTNIPGFAKSLVKDPLDTIATGVQQQWHQGGLGTKALLIGAPAMSLAHHIKSRNDPERRTNIKNDLLGLSLLPFGSMPMGTQMLAQAGLGKLLVRKRQQQQPQYSSLGQNPAPPETNSAATGLASPVEHQYSDRASGNIQFGATNP